MHGTHVQSTLGTSGGETPSATKAEASELDLEIQTDVFCVEGARMASQGEEAL